MAIWIMRKKDWEIFEENATAYLNSNINNKNYKFCHSGGADSTLSDIALYFKTKLIFYIECKLRVSQAGQFVVKNDVLKKIFFDSEGNKGNKNRRTPIIDHMNNNYSHYSSNSSANLLCNENIMFDAIKDHYKSKKVKFLIASNQHLDFPKNFIKIIYIDEIQDHFNISGVYREKRSGSRDIPKKDLNNFRKVISQKFKHYDINTINKKTYLITNEKIESLYLDKKKYFLSEEKENTYRIKKRSMTRNSNIIFTLVFKPKDTTDNGLSKLKEEIKKTK